MFFIQFSKTSIGQSISISADVHQQHWGLPTKHSKNADSSQSGLPYGYENILPKRHANLDEMEFVSTIVSDLSSYNTDTSTTMTSATSDDVLSSTDDERSSRPIRTKRRQMRQEFVKTSSHNTIISK